MSVKYRSALITFGSISTIVVLIGVVIYKNVLSGFQAIENQRVERNIRRVAAIIEDRSNQLKDNLGDWTIWDDTYTFLQDKNDKYIQSNISQESFKSSGVDEALFINRKGELVTSFQIDEMSEEKTGLPQNLMNYFSTGSALLNVDTKTDFKKGILKVDNKLIIFAVRAAVKSDGEGASTGWVVFAKYFDNQIINSMKELTQFEANISLWENPYMSADFQEAKNIFSKNTQSNTLVKNLNEKIISGYYIVKDYYGQPQAIVRSDIGRDIFQQGISSMKMVMVALILSGLLVSLLQFGMIDSVVLKKILSISFELKNIGTSSSSKKRLRIAGGNDEIDILRTNINLMLDDIELSQNKLHAEVEKRESLVELISSIVVMLDPSGHITMINKRGCEILGYVQDELIGKNWFEAIIIPEEQEMIQKKFSEIISSTETNNVYIENSILTKDKKILIYGWHNTIVKNSDNGIVSTLSVGNDISQIKIEQLAKEDYTNSLKKMNDVMIGRELKMIELKRKIGELEKKS